MKRIRYPSPEKIIELNILVLAIINVKIADEAKVLSYLKILDTIDECKNHKGDLYDKSVVLMQNIIKSHAFASGNRRTALIVTKYFLKDNKGKFKIRDDPKYAKVMQGIREDFYSHEEIKDWINNGKIREYKR